MTKIIDLDRIESFVKFLEISKNLNSENLTIFKNDLIALVQGRKSPIQSSSLIDVIARSLNKILVIKGFVDICPCYDISRYDENCLIFRSVDNSYLTISIENLSIWITDNHVNFQKLKPLF